MLATSMWLMLQADTMLAASMQLSADQGNLEEESFVAAILYGGELLYLRICSYLSPPSNFVKRELPFLHGLKSHTPIGYCMVNHVVAMSAECAE